jgi:hypothetical protein
MECQVKYLTDGIPPQPMVAEYGVSLSFLGLSGLVALEPLQLLCTPYSYGMGTLCVCQRVPGRAGDGRVPASLRIVIVVVIVIASK